MRTYPSFTLWASDQAAGHRRLIGTLRRLVGKAAPFLAETVKWGNGCFTHAGLPIIYLHAEPDHLQFGFFGGVGLDDPQGRLEGSGKFVRHVKIRTAKDIDARYLARLIRQAAKIDYRDRSRTSGAQDRN